MAELGSVEGKTGAHIVADVLKPFAKEAEEVGEKAGGRAADDSAKRTALSSTREVIDPHGRLGPDVIDHSRPGGDLIPPNYDRFAGSDGPDGFIKDHWDPDKVNVWDGREHAGDWKYPDDDGFRGPTIRDYDPPVGTRMDRFGGTGGDFTAEPGTPFDQRALPPDSLGKDYHVYELRKPFDEASGYPRFGETNEAFGQPGGGMQYKLPQTVQWLLDHGYLEPTT